MVTTKRRLDGARWSSTLFIVFTVAFAAFLVPTGSAASASASAALPTFSTPCFTPAAIYNGLPPQQTSSYTVPATGVSTVRAVLGTVRVTGQRTDQWHMRYSAHEKRCPRPQL